MSKNCEFPFVEFSPVRIAQRSTGPTDQRHPGRANERARHLKSARNDRAQGSASFLGVRSKDDILGIENVDARQT